MINYKIEFYDEQKKTYVDYTECAVFPLKLADMLDEQLDEGNVTLKQCDKPYFNPLTLVKITITNTPEVKFSASDIERFKAQMETKTTLTYDSETKRITETRTLEMIVASDNAIEQPIGSGLYNHEIYLIELTKILEGYIGDSISFTNALGNDYIGENS